MGASRSFFNSSANPLGAKLVANDGADAQKIPPLNTPGETYLRWTVVAARDSPKCSEVLLKWALEDETGLNYVALGPGWVRYGEAVDPAIPASHRFLWPTLYWLQRLYARVVVAGMSAARLEACPQTANF